MNVLLRLTESCASILILFHLKLFKTNVDCFFDFTELQFHRNGFKFMIEVLDQTCFLMRILA